MCGYLGAFSFSQEVPALHQGIEYIKNRGEDHLGVISQQNLFLAHASLSITDDSFKQPVTKGRDFLVFNGEIYNYQEIKDYLKRNYFLEFKSKGDTEVLFQLLQKEGIQSLWRLNGMFSIAYFDSKKEKLFLIRDRLGIKPLYYFFYNEQIRFSTELRSLVFDQKNLKINQQAIQSLSMFRYNLNDQSIFEGFFSLKPGHYLEISEKGVDENQYWDMDLISDSKTSSLEEVKELIEDSIRLRVPGENYGLYLSGGLDSSFLSISAHHYNSNQTAYCWNNKVNSELESAENLAKMLNIDLLSIQRDLEDFELFQDVQFFCEQPLLDSITLVNFCLGKEVSKNHRIVLSGEGADEVFGGYIHHKVFAYAQLLSDLFPFVSFPFIAQLLQCIPIHFFQSIFPYPGKISKKGIQKLVLFFENLGKPYQAYSALTGLKDLDSQLDQKKISYADKWNKNDLYRSLIYFDFKKWSSHYSLPMIDKLNSCHTIEARVPYYDHRLVEWSLKAPMNEKINFFQDKRMLRAVFKDSFSDQFQIYNRKKYPFYLENNRETEFLQSIPTKNPYDHYFNTNVSGDDLLSKKSQYTRVLFEAWFEGFKNKMNISL